VSAESNTGHAKNFSDVLCFASCSKWPCVLYQTFESAYDFLLSCLCVLCSPSISDKTRAGYFSQDCASQTEKSDLINVKEVTHMVQILVQVKISTTLSTGIYKYLIFNVSYIGL
jgi:hypothetical protein